jgi:hypothetical protein
VSLVSELVTAGFLVNIEDGQVVVGHKLDLRYEPYRLWRINRVDQLRLQDRHPVPVPPNPLQYDFPHDKYEYWDYLTEKALETHQRLRDNQADRDQERRDNIAELREAMEEAWGKPKLTTLYSMLVEQGQHEKELQAEKHKLQQLVKQPEEVK